MAGTEDTNEGAAASSRRRARPLVGLISLGLGAALALALAVVGVLGLTVGLADAADCAASTITARVTADSWVDEDSPATNKGMDPLLAVDPGSVNVDTGVVSGRARALVRFRMPRALPSGCVVESARLHLFSSEETAGTRVEAVRLASAWSESGVTWSDQPHPTGAVAAAWSREGYMHWNVTSQVRAIYASGADHGFLLRDSAEGIAEASGNHGFYAREKGEDPPKLVIRFAPPPSGEAPGPPAPPTRATVHCGQVIVRSTLVANDLVDCPGDGLVIGAPRIIVDLGGRTLDGIGLGTGVRNESHASVTIRNGTVQEFDHGVLLDPETTLNVVADLSLQSNQLAGVELFDAQQNEIRSNTILGNGDGIALVSGTGGTMVSDNTVARSGGAGLLVRDSDANRLERNRVADGGDLGIGLERSDGNTLAGNTVVRNSDGGIVIAAGSDDNRVQGNRLRDSGDTGILVAGSVRNSLISNVSHGMSDSGITLEDAHHGVVRGNDVRFNAGGLQLDGSSRNRLRSNTASDTTGIGIELGGGSFGNHVVRNTADGNGSVGIYVADEAETGPGNVLEGNTVRANGSDGIVVAKGGHAVFANIARGNRGWGIDAAIGSTDGGFNVATANGQPGQCLGVVCRAEWTPPETSIDAAPDATTTQRDATFAFSANESGSTFQCSLDGAPFTACTPPRRYTGLGVGPHTFRVRATDRAGNTDPSPARHAWTVRAT